jgi:hypothetical protein
LVDIQTELKSVKALLLSRRQFPATPATASIVSISTKPSASETVNLPSWQLQKSLTSAENEILSLVSEREE